VEKNHYENVLKRARELDTADRMRLIAAISADLAAEFSVDKHQVSSIVDPEARSQNNVDPLDGPLLIVDDPNRSSPIVANGIDVATGLPLLTLDAVAARRFALADQGLDIRKAFHERRIAQHRPTLGLIHGVSYDELAEAGWALIVHSHDDTALLKALTPLIRHRSQQQGIELPEFTFRPDERCGDWVARYTPVDSRFPSPWHPQRQLRLPILLYEGGEAYTCNTFLGRNGVMSGPVNPKQGVPFYLLIAGRPGPLYAGDTAFIPLDFQYDLDIFWGVGRICFTNAVGQHDEQAYTDYAEQLVEFEQCKEPPYSKHIVYFATRHQRDASSVASEEQLVRPLAEGDTVQGIEPPNHSYGFSVDLVSGVQATRANLSAILSGVPPIRKPALLFSATHGAGLRSGNPNLPTQQGALICQDWSGVGTVREEHWLGADNLPDSLDVKGLVAILFACYSAGCPQYDMYATAAGRVREIAPRTLISALAQRLLRSGALAVIGHVDRAWNYSFSVPELHVNSQIQGFDDLLRRLMSGGRLGFATDQFNLRQAAFGGALSTYVKRALYREAYNLSEIGSIWKAYNDARSYIVVGDPAAHLPFSPTTSDAAQPSLTS
jgi:hypothetical protein